MLWWKDKIQLKLCKSKREKFTIEKIALYFSLFICQNCVKHLMQINNSVRNVALAFDFFHSFISPSRLNSFQSKII